VGTRPVQDAVEAQMGPLLRDNKPRWLGDVKMTRFTMGSKVPEHHDMWLCVYVPCNIVGQGCVGCHFPRACRPH